MRPVRLDLDGFATFRTLAVIDFTDTDFFALVGATGAGKSTVIDAITFALYGTVPRWNDQRMITPALAPTATRGVVRLIFDADGQRYAVAREARRSGGKTSRVTMHASRLERLHDSDDPNGTTDILAADSEVTGAVEQLLGLSYQHFTTCVALPQGRFAEFLHAKPSDRQDILSSLLGYQLYDDLHALANSRARDHRANVTALDTTLIGYSDATAAIVADQTARAERLNELQTWLIDTVLPGLDTAGDARTTTHATLTDLTSRKAALAAVTVPGDVIALDTALGAATQGQVDTQTFLTNAEHLDTVASAAATAFRPRFELQTLQQQWADFAIAKAQLPGLIADTVKADTTLAAAREETASTEATTETLRQTAAAAAGTAEAAEAAVTAAVLQLTALAAISTPTTITELAETLADLRRRREAVDLDSRQADDDYTKARIALNAALSDSVLGSGQRAAATIANALRSDLATVPERDLLATAATVAADAVTHAEELAQQASDALDDARRADVAGGLRVHMHPGQPCPVCEQVVTTVPKPATTDIAGHEQRMAAARTTATKAHAALTALDKQVRAADATRTARLSQAEAARPALNDALSDLRTVAASAGEDTDALLTLLEDLDRPIAADASTDTVPRAAGAAERAQTVLTTAIEARLALTEALARVDRRRDASAQARRELEQDTEAVDGDRAAAATALNAVRDTVSSLGAPAVDPAELAEAWTTLTTWAAREHAVRSTALLMLQNDAATALAAVADAKVTHIAAAAELTRVREAESGAVQLLAQVTSQRDNTAARQTDLETALTGQPDAATVGTMLAELDARETAAAQARSDLEGARARQALARTALEMATSAVTINRNQLTAARDPLTRFGAPALSTGSLAIAWNELADWATATAEGLTREIGKAQEAADNAATAYGAAVTAVCDRLTANDLPAPADSSTAALRSAAAATAARAAATAQSAATHATERLAERHRLENERTSAAQHAQVAGALAQLLRSDGFRAWLLESALASLVSDASAILFDMSSGQFELTTTSKDLEVIDHNDADSHRPVRTLSGGETFQASLTLALALSRQVATLAASGAAKLESIFLDEGFGTLDETSLDVVADTLEILASSGERMVGVITHVPALAERIPVRFLVTRTGHSSTVTRVGL